MRADYVLKQNNRTTTTFAKATVVLDDTQEIINLVSVATRQGEIQGQLYTTPHGTQMKLFRSIPYAEEPDRFEIPDPKSSWDGLIDATAKKGVCPQVTNGNSVYAVPDGKSDEDCLYLKLMIPVPANSSKFPVLFWPHGGGFSSGSSQNYDIDSQGDQIVSKGIIIVQPSYRVGPFGFFSTGGEEAKGNYGVWDVLRALQFVYKNIGSFGGDKKRITLFGHGAGGAMASLLSLSPLAQGLFSGAIILSASAFAPKINQLDSSYLEKNRNFAIIAGCDRVDGYKWEKKKRTEILECLKRKSVKDLLTAAGKFSNDELFWHPKQDGEGGIWPTSLDHLATMRKNIPGRLTHITDKSSWRATRV